MSYTNLQEPWLALAEKLGGAGKLYAELGTRVKVSNRTAIRLCREDAPLHRWQWNAVRALFVEHGLEI